MIRKKRTSREEMKTEATKPTGKSQVQRGRKTSKLLQHMRAKELMPGGKRDSGRVLGSRKGRAARWRATEA